MLNSTVVRAHNFNGFADGDDKFVEVDGKKFVDDGAGKPKLDEKQQPIPFVEKPVTFSVEELASMDLEALAKTNPKVAKFLSDKKEADGKLTQAEKDKQERDRKDAESRGEWQKIAEDEKKKREDAERKLNEKDELLGKYKGSVEAILKDVIATIPKENLQLIPDGFSPRQKLEYITRNAKLLGAKINAGKGDDGTHKNDDTPDATEEQKLVSELDALVKKGKSRTAAETQRMTELGTKITDARRKADAEKKK